MTAAANNPTRMHPAPGLLLAFAAAGMVCAAVPEEFRVKREAEFEFDGEPAVRADGDRVVIEFATRSLCDVTVAIEDAAGRIRRHLASGVLGPDAPPPLKANTTRQQVVWDGKDDQDRYLDDRSDLFVRVSLGLRPRLEKVLIHSPKKRVSRGSRPLIAAGAEGVFVFEGEGVDFLRQFDHEGNYVKTVYPFPADKLAECKGLKTAVFPQDQKSLPLKHGVVQATLLTSGKNTYPNGWSKYQAGASAIAVAGKRIALAYERLNRLSTDGTTGGLPLEGPQTGVPTLYRNQKFLVGPRSAALSPDGQTLYLTGYRFKPKYPRPNHWLPCVMKLRFEGDAKLELFAGSTALGGHGTEPGRFRVPTCVRTDAAGRVYVADFKNDRIQVFTPDGKIHKIIDVHKPVEIHVHRKTGEIFVASWMILNRWNQPGDVPKPKYTRLGPVENPKVRFSAPLPIIDHNPKVFMNKTGGFPYTFAVDDYADEPTIWLVGAHLGFISKLMIVRGAQDRAGAAASIRLYVERDGALKLKQDFGKEVVKTAFRAKPPIHSRQKMYVNPANGRLYIFEGQAGVSKSCKELLEIDPLSGKIREMRLKFDAEDLAFDINGLIYLRTDNVVGRFDPRTWKEVPFDYGEQRKSVGFSSSRGGRRTSLASAIVMPSKRPGCFHQGGMHVNAKGNLAVSCHNVVAPPKRDQASEIRKAGEFAAGRKWTPKLYPGRQRYGEVHIWDKHGQLLYEDAFKGLPMIDGVAIDAENAIYVLASPNRAFDGEPYFLERAETLMKARPGEGRLLHIGKGVSVPLDDARPDRPADAYRGGKYWAEGVQWMYGGVGFGGFNSSKGGGGCACWHTRFALDYFARSFAPEIDHFSIAVLDANGNLICRIGQYGNADSYGPQSPVPLGGDEVGLFDAAYVSVHTDHRLFIADGGNARILSVKLDYHKTRRWSLAGVSSDAQ